MSRYLQKVPYQIDCPSDFRATKWIWCSIPQEMSWSMFRLLSKASFPFPVCFGCLVWCSTRCSSPFRFFSNSVRARTKFTFSPRYWATIPYILNPLRFRQGFGSPFIGYPAWATNFSFRCTNFKKSFFNFVRARTGLPDGDPYWITTSGWRRSWRCSVFKLSM